MLTFRETTEAPSSAQPNTVFPVKVATKSQTLARRGKRQKLLRILLFTISRKQHSVLQLRRHRSVFPQVCFPALCVAVISRKQVGCDGFLESLKGQRRSCLTRVSLKPCDCASISAFLAVQPVQLRGPRCGPCSQPRARVLPPLTPAVQKTIHLITLHF